MAKSETDRHKEAESPTSGAESPWQKARKSETKKPTEQLIVPYSWRGALPGWKCNVGNCQSFYTDKGDAILHVINHFPVERREAIMNDLLKE